MFKKKELCNNYIIYESGTIKAAISAIEKGGIRIVLILNNDGKIIGTICDGDIRRGLLKGLNLESSFESIIQKNFIYASLENSKQEIYKLMRENAISQIPIIDRNYEFIGLEISDNLLLNSKKIKHKNSALLMAGGRGTRLRPLTNDCPKPLLEIEGKPILEIILEQCIDSGIRTFFISVCYLAEKIIDYFGDGKKWNVQINYLRENKPLGTAGALNLLPNNLVDPILVINGDVLSKVKFQDIFNYHNENAADITLCAREDIITSPYGVIEVDGNIYKSMIEKPSIRQLVNAGIYVIRPQVIDFIKNNTNLDMPSFIDKVKSENKRVLVYPVHEYWIDIGKPDLLSKAHFDWRKNL